MKLFLQSVVVVLALFSGQAFGDTDPCQVILKACMDAGFSPVSNAPNKSMIRDCFKPILKGDAVTGVSVDPSVVEACRNKRPPSARSAKKAVTKP